MPNISTRQKSLLHVAKAKLGLSDEDYRAILFSAAGVESSKDLDTAGFERVLERFVQLRVRRAAQSAEMSRTQPGRRGYGNAGAVGKTGKSLYGAGLGEVPADRI